MKKQFTFLPLVTDPSARPLPKFLLVLLAFLLVQSVGYAQLLGGVRGNYALLPDYVD